MRVPRGLEWGFRDKPFTAWGGLRVLEEMRRRLGWNEVLAAAPLPPPGSNRGMAPVLMVEAFLVRVWRGGGRFAHTALVRFDAALRAIFGLKPVGSVSTFTRFLRRFGRKEVEGLLGTIATGLGCQVGGGTGTVDLDSSVLTRYGQQEGRQVGYNPRHCGKPSHHPLMAFAAECRRVVTAGLGPGNRREGSNVENFFQAVLAVLGPRPRIGLRRCDCDFCLGSFLDLVESQSIHYGMPVRMLATIRRQVSGIGNWIALGGPMAVAEFQYPAQGGSRVRPVVVVGQPVRDQGRGRRLLEVPGYTYSLDVTNLDLPALQVRALYPGRADRENRMKEWLHDFAIGGFVRQKFGATARAFRLACLAYNLMSLFRQTLLGGASQPTLSTLRTQGFAIGASLGKAGHHVMLRLGLPPPRRAGFRGWCSRAEQIISPCLVENANA